MTDKFDVTVIGGGPAGYVCAIRLAQLGLNTACIESRGSLGGTCLNIGCIPSKSLLNLSENFHKAKNFADIGIETGEVKLNLKKMMENKDKSVLVLTKGVEFLFKKNKVTYIKGTGTLKSRDEILVKVRSTGRLIKANVNCNNDTANIKLLEDEYGISPGQACVFYSKNKIGYKVLGGGWITKN